MHQVGKYEILSEIGRGAMGAVYKARDPFIGRLVALKTITTGLSAQANSLERFYQEARSAGALQHPHIVTIYELGHENNTPFIAMEYIEGESLDDVIGQRQILPLSVKLGYIVHVCDALSYAHQHNVVHRDIKPGNIMVAKEGTVKVVDFGIARLTDMSLTQPNMMIGSRAYMSPELYKGERADARADIWALGVTLYELLAYRRPFVADSEAELMFHIMSDIPPGLQSLGVWCPGELPHIIGKMLEKKAEERYQSMDDVLRDLEPVWKSAQQSTVSGLLADSQALIAASDLQRAQGLLRKALKVDAGSTQAKSLLEKVTAELRRSQILPKVNEHLERGRSFLCTGKLREARAEVEAALGLDSRHEPAQRMFAEVEAATARAQEVEQKLRLTKQRLAEGALTEAAAALGQALELDSANVRGQELKRQIEEERNRREKRKKLSEVLHHARTLWTALNYEECLQALTEGLREFPAEPELVKLQEMARHDLDDLQKQRRLGEVRKLLGEQDFAEARKVIDGLAKEYPQDSAVKNLLTLVLDGEKERQRNIRYTKELSVLRVLLSDGKFGDAVVKGDVLLREYPEEFELRELVEYARGELTQQEQRQKEKEREEQILGFLERGNYLQAETTARRAAQEFPKQELFRRLAEEAGQKRQAHEQRERAHQEMQRRIDEIQGKIKQEKMNDAIDLAQQTLGAFGPHPEVTQLLQTASSKQAERKKKEDQENQIAAARTLIDAGKFADATRVLNQAMATQIFERSDPRLQQQLQRIQQLSVAAKSRSTAKSRLGSEAATGAEAGIGKPPEAFPRSDVTPAETGSYMFSATMAVGSQSTGTSAKAQLPSHADRPRADDRITKKPPAIGRAAEPGSVADANVTGSDTAGKQAEDVFAAGRTAWEKARQWAVEKWPLIQSQALALVKRPAVLVGAGTLLVVVLLVALVAGRLNVPSEREKKIRLQATQFWKDHQLDQSEQAWRQLQQLHGFYGKEASRQISQIQEKRETERRRFDEGERLLKDQKNFVAASQVFQDVIAMNLWLAEDAQRELTVAQTLGSTNDVRGQEKLHFDQGEKFFQGGNYDSARKEFQIVADLNIPDSTVRGQADNYLKKLRQAVDTRKIYEAALGHIKNEDWAEAQRSLQEVVGRKGSLGDEARQRLSDVALAVKAQEAFNESLQAAAYRDAKSQVDGMQRWPKTQARLQQDLRSAEHHQAEVMGNRANSLKENGDVDGIVHLRDELHNFGSQVEDTSLIQWTKDLDQWLADAARKLRDREGDKAAFDAAVAEFNTAKEKGDLKRLGHEVMRRFKQLAEGSGTFRDQAQTYVNKTIPGTIQELTKSVGNGKLIVPPIVCAGSRSSAPPQAGAQILSCEQLDPDVSLQWVETPTVEFPGSASQPGKLPYTLHLNVVVDPSGKVQVQKSGTVDKDFFKKAKDASKYWRTTIPRSGGRPASVSFPLAITFQR